MVFDRHMDGKYIKKIEEQIYRETRHYTCGECVNYTLSLKK